MNRLKIAAIIIAFAPAVTLSGQAYAGPVNINTATVEQLDMELNGVGPTIAQRIVEYRKAQGEFTQAEQLVEVKGIGDKTLSKNAEFILLE